MNSIQFVNKLTPKQWESVYADNHLSDIYHRNNNDPKKLEIEMVNRVRTLCENAHLPIPKKIVVTYELNDAVKMMNSGELRIHPLTFVASKLDRNAMTSKHQALYGRLENYLAETGSLLLQHRNPTNNENAPTYCDSIEYKQSAKELLQRYRTELADDLQDYKYILPVGELDEVIVYLLTMHKAYKYPTIGPTVAKLASLSIATLNGLATGWMISKITAVSMYSPIAASGALIIAGGSYLGLKIAERVGRFIVGNFFDQDMMRLVLKPWKDRPFESQIIWLRLELIRGEVLPKF